MVIFGIFFCILLGFVHYEALKSGVKEDKTGGISAPIYAGFSIPIMIFYSNNNVRVIHYAKLVCDIIYITNRFGRTYRIFNMGINDTRKKQTDSINYTHRILCGMLVNRTFFLGFDWDQRISWMIIEEWFLQNSLKSI